MKLILTVFLMVTFSMIAHGETMSERKARIINQNQAMYDYIVEHRDEIIGIEYIMLKPPRNVPAPPQSKLGHGMIRLVTSDPEAWLENPTLGFVGVSEGGDSFMRRLFKVFTGGFDVEPELDTMEHFWNLYGHETSRTLERFIIPTTPKQRDQIIQDLLDRRFEKFLPDHFSLNWNNCSRLIGLHMQNSGVVGLKSPPIIPLNWDHWLKNAMVSFYPGLPIVDREKVFEKFFNLINVNPKKYSKIENWPNSQEIMDKIVGKMTNEEIQLIAEMNTVFPKDLQSLLDIHLDEIGLLNGPEKIERVYGHINLDPDFYNLCESRDCFDNVQKQVYSIYTEEQLKKVRKDLSKRLRKLNRRVKRYSRPRKVGPRKTVRMKRKMPKRLESYLSSGRKEFLESLFQVISVPLSDS